MTRPFLAALLALPLALPAPGHAQTDQTTQATQTTPRDRPAPGFFDIVTFENLLNATVQSIVASARLFADIRYQQASLDPQAMRLTLLDLDIRPRLPDMPVGSCVATIGRVTLAGQPFDSPTATRLNIAIDDLDLGLGCLPAPARAMVMGLGLQRIDLPRADLLFHYDIPSGGAVLSLTADLDNVAAFELQAEADYLSLLMDLRTEEPTFALDLSSVQLTLDDRGGWAMGSKMIPPQMQSPEALEQLVTGAVTQALTEANSGPLTQGQQSFATQAGAVARGFAEGNRRIVLATDIAAPPFRIDEETGESFAALFDGLAPRIGHAAPRLDRVIPVAVLQQALNAETTPPDALALGRAMLTGIGAPRNINSGLILLAKASRGGDAEAAFLIAEALAEDQPETAYGHALRAAALDHPGALGVLDMAERGLSYARMMELQTEASPDGPDPALYGSVLEMRRTARGFLTGIGRPRSYRAAYYWAAMAAAAGDASGAVLRDEITETMRLRGDAAPWAEEATNLDNGVLRDWISQDLPARLQ